MRDYDETFKEMKKENFNLKLRIFFLEERMGLGGNGGREELARENLELKVALESCRAELEEQTGLVLEASQALEKLDDSKGDEKEEEVKRRGKIARSPGPTFSRKINFFSEKEDLSNNNLNSFGINNFGNINSGNLGVLPEEGRVQELEASLASTQERLTKAEEEVKEVQRTATQRGEEIKRLQGELERMQVRR